MGGNGGRRLKWHKGAFWIIDIFHILIEVVVYILVKDHKKYNPHPPKKTIGIQNNDNLISSRSELQS